VPPNMLPAPPVLAPSCVGAGGGPAGVVEGFVKDQFVWDAAAAGVVDPNEGVGPLGVPNIEELLSAGLLGFIKLIVEAGPELGCEEWPNRLEGGFGSLPALPNKDLDSPALLFGVFWPLPNEKPVFPAPNNPPPEAPDVPNKEPDEAPLDAAFWKLNVILKTRLGARRVFLVTEMTLGGAR
jgi:hypothetical protein